MNKELRVLFLLNKMDIGGAERDVIAIAKAFTTRGLRVAVASGGGILVRELLETGICHHEINIDSIRGMSFPQCLYGIFKIIKKQEINVINTHSIRATLLAGIASQVVAIGLHARRPRVIATIHNIHDRKNDNRAAWILNHFADHVMVVSEYERSRLIKYGLKSQKTTTVYSGMDVEELSLYRKRTPLIDIDANMSNDTKIITCVARLTQQKGVHVFLYAAKRILVELPNTLFFIIGDGPLRIELEKVTSTLGITQNVKFLGFRQDVHDLLATTDVFVLSSLRESLPRAIREAMVMGKPVVASKVGGVPEIITHGQTGFLVPPNDPDSLAEYVLMLLKDKQLAVRIGASGQKVIMERFDMEEWIDQVNGIFLEALAQ